MTATSHDAGCASQRAVHFQYMSDLHLELFPGFRIRPEDVRAPFLVLAGDVGTPATREYTAFLASCARLYEKVFVVLGNHEGYGKPSWQQAVEDARKTAAEISADDGGGAVVVLHNDAYDIVEGAVRVLGCTLWSDVSDDERSDVQMLMMDYRNIGGGFNVDLSRHMHSLDVAWLKRELQRARRDGVKCVVVTHHAPLIKGTSDAKYSGSGVNSAFATDLSDMISAHVDVAPFWIHGHTHHSHVLEVPPGAREGRGGGEVARVVSNQRGYASVREEIEQFRVDAAPLVVAL